MRIALQISGELRLINHTWNAIKTNILESSGNTIDIFLHAWEKDPSKDYIYSSNEAIELYKPCKYLIEDYTAKEDLHKLPKSMSMYYSIWKAYVLRKDYEKENNITYDIIMRSRTDCMVNENPFKSLEDIFNKTNKCIIIPRSTKVNVDGPVGEDTGDGYCDWIAWGTPDVMEIYSNIYCIWLNQEYIPVPESMLSMALQLYNLKNSTILHRPMMEFYLLDETGKMRGS